MFINVHCLISLLNFFLQYNQNPILDIDVIYKYLLNYMRDSGQIKIAPNKPGHGPGQSILNQLHSYTLNR